jgi:flagellar biosynthesis/type III secretory pathway protein FliH
MGIEEFLLDEAYKKGFKEGFAEGYQQGFEEAISKMTAKMEESGLDAVFIASIAALSTDALSESCIDRKVPELLQDHQI